MPSPPVGATCRRLVGEELRHAFLLAGATGVIGHQAVPVLAAAGHQVTGLAGAANAHARQLLDWKPTYSSWRDGLTASCPGRT